MWHSPERKKQQQKPQGKGKNVHFQKGKSQLPILSDLPVSYLKKTVYVL